MSDTFHSSSQDSERVAEKRDGFSAVNCEFSQDNGIGDGSQKSDMPAFSAER